MFVPKVNDKIEIKFEDGSSIKASVSSVEEDSSAACVMGFANQEKIELKLVKILGKWSYLRFVDCKCKWDKVTISIIE